MIDPVQLSFDVVRHEDLRTTFMFTTEGRPIDITGLTAKFAIAASPGATPALSLGMAANTNGSRFTVVDGPGGVLELYVNKADHAALPTPGGSGQTTKFAYDILITGIGGADTNRFFFGDYLVEPGVAS